MNVTIQFMVTIIIVYSTAQSKLHVKWPITLQVSILTLAICQNTITANISWVHLLYSTLPVSSAIWNSYYILHWGKILVGANFYEPTTKTHLVRNFLWIWMFIITNKVFWLKKLWWIYGNSPNPPMFAPSKVFPSIW